MKYILIITIIAASFLLLISCSETDRELRLAEQGDVNAQYRMAIRYYRGEEVEQDYEEAVNWYRLAAKQGSPEAQVGLALCYMKGDGVEQNDQEAYTWLLLADYFLDEDDLVKNHVETVTLQAEELLTNQEIEQAKEEAQNRFDQISEESLEI